MTSAPQTPGVEDPRDAAEYRFRTNGIACEWGESYHPGGYHPTKLGDKFSNGRYHVIRKIGYGAYSTVWLVLDLQMCSFAALKIAIASTDRVCIEKELALYGRLGDHSSQVDGARRFVHLRDFFRHSGPNGQHSCWVFEPLGPNVNTMLKRCPDFQIGEPWERRFTPHYAKRLLRDTLFGLDFLHSNDVVHGDLHPGNILVGIRPLETDDKMIQNLQTHPSQGSSLDRLDGKAELWAPPYLLEPDPLYDYTSADLEPSVKITDLGAAFSVLDPPEKTVTPTALRAPEIILGLPVGKAIDIWSFGCLVFELLTGQQLFVRIEALEGDLYDEQTNDEHLCQISDVIRRLPEHMSSHWRRCHRYFAPDGQRLDNTDSLGNEDVGDELQDSSTPRSDGSISLATPERFDPLEKQFRDLKPGDTGEAETEQILDLLLRLLQVDPHQRPSTKDVLEHPWFAMKWLEVDTGK